MKLQHETIGNRVPRSDFKCKGQLEETEYYILSLLAQDTFFMTNPFSLSSPFGPSIPGHCTIVSSDSSSFRTGTAFCFSSDPNPMFSDFSSFRFRPWTLIYNSSGSILPKRTSIGPLCTATRTFYPFPSVFYSGLFLLGRPV